MKPGGYHDIQVTRPQAHKPMHPQRWVPKDRGYLFALRIIQYSQRKKKNQFFWRKDRNLYKKGSFFDTFELFNHRSPKLAFYDVKPFLTLASRIYFSFSECRMCTIDHTTITNCRLSQIVSLFAYDRDKKYYFSETFFT